MWEGHEVGGDGVRGLGLPRVDVHLPRLRVLASSEGCRQNPQCLWGVEGSIPPANRSRASLLGGSWPVAIRIYREPGGCLCGACIHGTCPVCGSGGGWTISGASGAPQETLSWGARSCGGHGLSAWSQGLLDRRGRGLNGGTSVHSSIKLGAYAGRFTNLNLAEMNNPSPNLTTFYLDTPIVGPILDPLEWWNQCVQHMIRVEEVWEIGVGSRNDSRTKNSRCSCNQRI